MLRNRPLVRVAHGEMTDAIAVKEGGRKELRPGAWVRIGGGGAYKGDLARVHTSDTGGITAVSVIPRIDYSALLQRSALSLSSTV